MTQTPNTITVSGLTNTGKPKSEEIDIATIIDIGCVETDKLEQSRNHVPKYQLAIRTGKSQSLFYYATDEDVTKVVNEINDRRNEKPL
ncbi:MAG: hypothetical protein K8I03_16225 [Ignavibacteria bacterium]|nr:hypothetical protein [Ignavibacteria bacterium]